MLWVRTCSTRNWVSLLGQVAGAVTSSKRAWPSLVPRDYGLSLCVPPQQWHTCFYIPEQRLAACAGPNRPEEAETLPFQGSDGSTPLTYPNSILWSVGTDVTSRSDRYPFVRSDLLFSTSCAGMLGSWAGQRVFQPFTSTSRCTPGTQPASTVCLHSHVVHDRHGCTR